MVLTQPFTSEATPVISPSADQRGGHTDAPTNTHTCTYTHPRPTDVYGDAYSLSCVTTYSNLAAHGAKRARGKEAYGHTGHDARLLPDCRLPRDPDDKPPK